MQIHKLNLVLLFLIIASCSITKNNPAPLTGKTMVKSFPTGKSLFKENPENEIFTTIETPPTYTGCESKKGTELKSCYYEKLRNYINTNLVYPEIAKKNKIQGKVIAKYLIDKNGVIKNISVKGNEYLLDESLRLIKSLPKAIPAKQRGRPVEYEISYRFNFELKN